MLFVYAKWLLSSVGTGKTHVLSHTVNDATKANREVVVTSSTGISCTVLEKVGVKAQTVHDVFGLKNGR